MQIYRNFEGISPQSVFAIMQRLCDAESLTYSGIIRRDDYEWVIGKDVWFIINSNINISDFNIKRINSNFREQIYKIFDIEVVISRDSLNTIILRKKNKGGNEMGVENYIEQRVEDFAGERGLGWGVNYDNFTDSVHIRFWDIYSKGYGYAIDTREATTYTDTARALKAIFEDMDKKLIITHWTGHLPTIKDVIYNGPATIVFWSDGSKTVVKCQGDDDYDPEKGLAMAIAKKALGNKGNYCNIFKKWLPEEDSANAYVELGLDDSNFTKKLNNIIGDTILKKKDE